MFIDYSWYSTLIQPPLKPPAWIFTPIWIIFYISMGIALLYYIRKKTFQNKHWGYILFTSQLLVNLSWSPVFFGLKNIELAFVLIILLDLLVLINIILFFKISNTAGKILIPYFIWLIFATYLNFGLLILN